MLGWWDDGVVNDNSHESDHSFEITLPGDRRRWFLPDQQTIADDGGGFAVTAEALLDQPQWLLNPHLVSHLDRQVLEDVAREAAQRLMQSGAPRARR